MLGSHLDHPGHLGPVNVDLIHPKSGRVEQWGPGEQDSEEYSEYGGRARR
jgi:hypothetical protein